ncbi:MAG: GDSL-type esterase/lipase family protein [Candidatus Sumerlaeota bacterium]|nr:GDSL-type esterase/lipase family protein [Candidatus Sumerlaeota bacterium]
MDCFLRRWIITIGGMTLLSSAIGSAEKKEAYPLRDAVEFTVRNGLPNFFAKLNKGGETKIRIGYLGGSITAQAGWRPKTLQWFRQQYPKAAVDEINAAIGGTGSDLGVFRLQHDVLQFKPDLLFVEFAVNDGGADPARIHKAMEGIVRQTWRADPMTDICFVYTVSEPFLADLQKGKFPRAASAMEAVADHYGIPSIHMGVEVARQVTAGKVIFKAPEPKTDEEKAKLAGKILFSTDGVHPIPASGHQLYLEAVVRAMNEIKNIGKPGAHELKAPFIADNWEAAKMVALKKEWLSAGWEQLDPAKDSKAKGNKDRVPALWKATKPGETMTLKFKGTMLKVYDLLGPDCGQVIVKVDDQPAKIVPRFDAYCTYHRLATLGVADGLPEGVHTVKLEIHPDQPDKAKILKQNNNKIDDPKRFDGTTWYAGAVLLLGDVVE